jgi:hypothetical protein
MVVRLNAASPAINRVLGSFDPLSQILSVNLSTHSNASGATTMQELLAGMNPAILVHEMAHFWQISTTAIGLRIFGFNQENLSIGLRLIDAMAREQAGRIKIPIITNPPSNLSQLAGKLHREQLRLFARRLQVEGGWNVPRNSLVGGKFIGGGTLIELDGFEFCNSKFQMPIVLLPVEGRAVVLGTLQIFESWSKAAEMIAGRIHGVGSLRAGAPGTKSKRPSNQETYFAANSLFHHRVKQNPKTAFWGLEHLILVCDTACMLDAVVLGDDLKIEDLTPAQWFSRLLDIIAGDAFEHVTLGDKYSVRDVARFQDSLLSALGVPAKMVDLVVRCERFLKKLQVHYAKTTYNPNLVDQLLTCIQHQLRWRRKTLFGGAVLEDLFTSKTTLVSVAAGSLPAIAMGPKILSHKSKSGLAFGEELPYHQQIASVVNSLLLGKRDCFLNQNPRSCVVPKCDFCDDVSLIGSAQSIPDCQRSAVLNELLKMFEVRQLVW